MAVTPSPTTTPTQQIQRGLITSRPTGLLGIWVVAGRSFVANNDTEFDTGAALLREHLNHQTEWKPRLLSQTDPQRRVVEYSAPMQRVVGKFYTDDTGEHAFAAMQTVCQQLGESVLALPCPLFYSPTHRFLAQCYVEGMPYNDLQTSDRFDDFLMQAGAALATLHALPAPNTPPKTVAHHLADLIHPHPKVLAEQWPEYRGLIEAITSEMLRLEQTWQATPAPLHRDFHLRQLFYERGRTWLIDWDLFHCGDPALDVGNFVVYLKTHLLRLAMPSAVQAFLAGYFGSRSDELMARLPAFQALTYLRMACKHFRLQQVSWRDKVRLFWAKARRALRNEKASLFVRR
ncbi:MAG: aminoglycoside phosphotransferase family protein [Anaerolineae bacterium]|nr:aminoglycoside phosphotransferase family protein [Anaerolineae bacterium]